MDVFKTRRDNLRRLMRDWSGPANLAAKLGFWSASYLVQMAGPNPIRPITERSARRLEQALGLPTGSMDHPLAKSERVDESQVVQIVRVVGAVLDDVGVTLTPAQFADVVVLVSEHATLAGRIDEGYIKQLVKLLRK